MESAKSILVNKGIRPTPNRIAVLDVFIGESKSFPHARLMAILAYKINRVSLYRTLLDLVDAGILCRLMDSSGAAQYHYAVEMPGAMRLKSHFKCKNCEQIKALPTLPAAYVNQILSMGQIENSSLFIEGVCIECGK